MRLFVAIPLPDSVAAALAAFQRQLAADRLARVARFSPPHSIHLTLRFIGDVSPEKIPAIGDAIRAAAAPVHPLSLQPAGFGAFPNRRVPRVFWVGLAGDTEGLAKLANAIRTATDPFANKPDNTGFAPHLTIARFRRGHERAAGDLLEGVASPICPQWTAAEAILFSSQLRAGGAIHERLLAAPLSGFAQ